MIEQPKNESRRWNIWLPALLSIVMAAGMVVGAGMQDNPPRIANIEVPVVKKQDLPPSSLGQGKVEELIRYIEARYVDNVEKETLVKGAIDNILHLLDPHSSYIPAAELKAVNEQLEGSFEGIGIEYLLIQDTITVVSVLVGGPARSSGVLVGDKIISVNDTLVMGEAAGAVELLDALKGEKGAGVRVGVWRPAASAVLHFNMTREKLPVNTVSASFMLDDETGFIKIDRFSSHTYEEFMTALETLVERQGMKHLILDLRQNPGGYLQEAVNLLSQCFAEKERLLVYTEGSHSSRLEYKSTGRNFYDIGHLAVLVDEGSASASEIVAGALQDWDRAVIIGRRTFGKGLVQEQYPLRDGSAIRLTVARYYTPSGRSIQKPYGIGSDDYSNDLAERFKNGELFDPSKAAVVDSQVYKTQRGRIVYGGGGIFPDVFVALDSLEMNPYFLNLNSLLPSYTFRYLESRRPQFENMSPGEFASSFDIAEGELTNLIKFAQREGVAFQQGQWAVVKGNIRLSFKANLAKHLWSNEGFLQVMSREDTAVKRALELFSTDDPIGMLSRKSPRD